MSNTFLKLVTDCCLHRKKLMDVDAETTRQLSWNAAAAAKVIIHTAALTFLQGDELSSGLNLHPTGRLSPPEPVG